jgi:hypothetical protein
MLRKALRFGPASGRISKREHGENPWWSRRCVHPMSAVAGKSERQSFHCLKRWEGALRQDASQKTCRKAVLCCSCSREIEHGANDPLKTFSRDFAFLEIIFRRNIKAVASFAGAAAFFIASGGHKERKKAKRQKQVNPAVGGGRKKGRGK